MTTIRNEVFYRVERFVRKGDEFYQVVMQHHSLPVDLAFQVEMFHGPVGTLPATPERNEWFDSKAAAENKFNEWVTALESEGFLPYTEIIHGEKGFPEVH